MKLTLEEVKLIREKLRERWTAKQIQTIIPHAKNTTIHAINYGLSWFDENITYPISINNKRLWSDKEALEIKQKYADGATITELKNEYSTSLNAIQNLLSGKSYTNLPVIPRKVKWKRKNLKTRTFTAEEVIYYRQLVKQGRSMLSVYNSIQNPSCGYAAFYNMIKGITYQDINEEE